MYSIQKPIPTRKSYVRSNMPAEGSNELMMSQILTPSQATKILNYFIRYQTELYKRGGIRQRAKVSTVSASLIFREWTNTLTMIGYGTTLAVFNHNDDTINTIKSNFSTNLTGGVRYGLDFYSCNGKYGDKIYKTTLPTLAYDAQTVNFTVGKTITGATSGATATIVADSDSGATGTLTLDNIDGVFQNNEVITDSSGGSADVNGTVTYTNTAIITATAGTVPKCEALSVYDKSLVAIGTNNNDSEVLLSKQNLFTNWDTTAVTVGSAYSIVYSFAGAAVTSSNFQSVQSGTQSYGNVLVAGFKSGYAGFERSSVDIGGVITQTFPTVFEKLNDGMEKNSLTFPKGIAFANENGVFVLINHTNGERMELTSRIKRSRKANFDFTDVDFAWSSYDNRLYVSLRENSSVNNLILWFDTTNFKIWGEISYPVSRLFTKGNKVFGAASTSPRVLEMFSDDILDDEGAAIDYKYKQPMNTGSIDSTKDWLQLDVTGDLSPYASVKIKVLGVLEQGGAEADIGLNYTWSTTGGITETAELGTAELGEDAFVATPHGDQMVFTPGVGYKKAYNYNSFILEFSGSDKFPNIIRTATATLEIGRNQRQIQLTQI